MKFPVPFVANDALLVDQHEAGPVADPIQVPGLGIVVLSIGIRNVMSLERLLQVALVVLAGIGRELGGMNAGQGDPRSRYFRSKSTSEGTVLVQL